MVDLDEVSWWSFDLVREAMTEAVALWRRSPGDGRSPYATDGPWHLMLREVDAGDYDARGGFGVSSDVELRPLPLDREEVAQRDRVSEWLGFIDKEENRQVVKQALYYYAAGYQQVPWRKVRRQLALPQLVRADLKSRFDRAIRAVAEALNADLLRAERAKMVDAK